jgi:hypothetical protein
VAFEAIAANSFRRVALDTVEPLTEIPDERLLRP